ncbi:MAG TPA: hypothetical protein VLA43_10385 [Longimicrobiales bacterium]|nr:hypothetical protein [Longimicrobiales bacterium]
MRRARTIGTLMAVLGLATACTDRGPVAPLDDELNLDQEAELALSVLNDDLATEAALSMAEVSAPAAMRAGMGPRHQQNAGSLANQARYRFQQALQALGQGERLQATVRAREARRLVAQAMMEAGGQGALKAAVERMEHLEEAVQADMGAYEDAYGLLGELAMLRHVARNQMGRGNLLDAAATGVLAEQRHRFRYRWRQMDIPDRTARAEFSVGLGETAVTLAMRLLNEAGGPDEEQAVFLAIAQEQLAQAQAALEAGDLWRALHLAHLAQWSALKAVVLPGGVTDEEARALHELALTLQEQAVAAVGDTPTEFQTLLLIRVGRLIEHGEAKLADGQTRGIAAFWQAAVICAWLLG